MTEGLSPTELARKVRQHIRYDRDAVALFWRHRGMELFKTKAKARDWNSRNANQPALNNTYADGKFGGMFLGRRLYACDVVWLFEHGVWPHGDIHFRSGDASDHRPSNMMVIDPQITCPHTGLIGVGWSVHFRQWEAILERPNNEGRMYLGYFTTAKDAALAYDAAAAQHWADLAALNFNGEKA